MFLNILTYEFKLLSRSKWLLILFFTIALLIGFASLNGSKNVDKRLADIKEVEQEFFQKDSIMLETLKKIEMERP
jgi:ABC-2 type transport system permease protein